MAQVDKESFGTAVQDNVSDDQENAGSAQVEDDFLQKKKQKFW
jgi:hypothetical protein